MRYLTLLLVLLASPPGSAEPLRVAVAANFRSTLEQLNQQFQAQTGFRVVLSSGSTGVLYNQILHGAPFDLFFSADRAAATRLQAAGFVPAANTPFCYASGALVLVGGDGRLAQLADPRLSVAIANPVTAPYGVAATAVLGREQFRPGAARKLVRGNNVVQAFQFWHSKAVDLALVPRALAPTGTPIPLPWHGALEQHAIALTPVADKPALAAYLNWIRSDTVRTLITEAGYEPCP